MGLDVATIDFNFLPRPENEAYDFAWTLPELCTALGEGNAFGYFLRSQLLRIAVRYVETKDVDLEGERTILNWVESLPYDESGYINLHFNW